MRLIKKIKQSLCNHYFVIQLDESAHNNKNEVTAYTFKCPKCGLKLKFGYALFENATQNTLARYAELQANYLKMVLEYEPENYRRQEKKYE